MMRMKPVNTLYQISIALTAIPLIGGVLIFLIWWAARAFFAHNSYAIDTVGLYWLMISLGLMIIGFIFFIISVVKKQNPRWFKNLMIIIMLIALSFISLQIIVQKTSEIQEYAFVKLSNETSQNLKINFLTYLKTEKALLLKQGKSKVISFIPEYQMISDRNYEILPLVFEANEKKVEISGIDKNQCHHYSLDTNFKYELK